MFILAVWTAPGRAEGPGRPVILTVDGLNFKTFGCGKEIYSSAPTSHQNIANRAACAAVDILAKLSFGSKALNDANYLNGDLKNICSESCGEFYKEDFYWNGNVGESRKAVNSLKAKILEAAAYASEDRSKPRPLIIAAHSWGCVLTAEALAEIEGDKIPLRVDKLITLGSPLGTSNSGRIFGGAKYQLAVHALIVKQNFYTDLKKLHSVKKWVNYWASRDWVSQELNIEGQNIENIQLDAGPEYSKAEAEVRNKIATYSDPELGNNERLMEALDDIEKIGYGAGPTGVWHSIYMEGKSRIDLQSIHKTLDMRMYPVLEQELSEI